jgi:site-specific recombinase XerD
VTEQCLRRRSAAVCAVPNWPDLTVKHVQQRDNRWCVVNLLGKHGRLRTIPMPAWVKNAIDAWTAEAAVTDGHLFRPVNRGDQVSGERMSEKVVWQTLKTYVAGAGLPDIAPHDLRRTTAKLCRAAGGDLEQIQLLLCALGSGPQGAA